MQKSQIIKKCAFASCISIVILIVVSLILRYSVEGEKNMPYKLDKILVVSTIDGKTSDDTENIWNIDLKQVNDLYLYISKNDLTNETIKQIEIKNFSILSQPKKGDVVIYRPTGELSNLYTYSEQNYLESGITYTGGQIDDLKTLEIANTGGVIGFRVSLDNLGKYTSSNDQTEITYDGTLLNSIGINLDDIKLSMSFDIVIQTNDGISYQGNVSVNLPDENIIENGSGNFEINDFNDVIFKRVKN